MQFAGVIAEAKELVANGGNAQQLREENLTLYKEKEKALQDLKAFQKALRDSDAKAKAQAEKDAQTIKELQDSLNLRLDEITALDRHILGALLAFFPPFLDRFDCACLIVNLALQMVTEILPG